MTAQHAEAVQEAVALSDPDAGFQQAGARGRAKSVPTALPTAPAMDPAAGLQERAQKAAHAFTAKVQAALTALATGDSLFHAHPKSLAQAIEHHQAAVQRKNGWATSVPRSIYAVFHVLIKIVTHAVDWVTESPPKLLVALAIIAVTYIWI